MFKLKTKREFLRILPFGLIWLLSGWIFLVVELAAVGGAEGLPKAAIGFDLRIFVFSSLAMLGIGLLVGLIEMRYLNNRFSRYSFTRKLIYKFLLYTFFLFLIIGITFPMAAAMELNTNLLDNRVWERYFEYFRSLTHLSTVLQLAVALGVCLIYAEVGDNIGHGVLLNFFTGKYHQPIEEKRIFLFLDMKSSTTIAEKLGHIEYFKLLREYYADLSDAVEEYGGDIYQYVGDEMVVTWDYRTGTHHNNCLHCFFDMRRDLRRRHPWYEKRFGIAPTFKAGLHLGMVTTGEVGVIKQEIIFTGDVLNATARIQGSCNSCGVDLLLSGEMLESLDPGPEFEVRSLGTHELRGKQETMELYTIALSS